MSERVEPLSLDVMREALGPEIAAARDSVRAWLNDGPAPDFEAIAELAAPALETLVERGWVQVNDEWRKRLANTQAILRDPTDLRYRGRVTELLELVWNALAKPRPRPQPPRGPLAAEMSLGKKRP